MGSIASGLCGMEQPSLRTRTLSHTWLYADSQVPAFSPASLYLRKLPPASVVLWRHFPPVIRFSKRSEWRMERSSRWKTSLSLFLSWDPISPLVPTDNSLLSSFPWLGTCHVELPLPSLSQFLLPCLLPLMPMEMLIIEWRRTQDLEKRRPLRF